VDHILIRKYYLREFQFTSNFFLRENPVQIFLPNFCILTQFFVHYALILKRAAAIQKYFVHFQCHQLIEILTKSCTQYFLTHFFNSSDKNFPFIIYHSFPEDVLLRLFSLLHHNLLILLQNILFLCKLLHFYHIKSIWE